MAQPTFIGAASSSVSTADNTLALPGSTAVGDLILVYLLGDSNAPPYIISPLGFTTIDYYSTNGKPTLLAYKIATAADVSAAEVHVYNDGGSFNRAINSLLVYRNARVANRPMANLVSTGTSPITVPEITVDTDQMAVGIGAYNSGTVDGYMGNFPGAYTERMNQSCGKGDLVVAEWLNTAASTTSPAGTIAGSGTFSFMTAMILLLDDVGGGPTRLYMDVLDEPQPVWVDEHAEWDSAATNTLRGKLHFGAPTLTPANGGTYTFSLAESDASVHDQLLGQFISDPMEAGCAIDTADVLQGIWTTRMQSGTDDFGTQLVVKVVSFDGGTVRAVLYGPHSYTTTSNTAAAVDREFSASGTHETRRLPGGAGDILTSYTTVAGDRLVVELGARACNASGSALSGDPRIITHWNVADFPDGTEGTGGVGSRTWLELTSTLTLDPLYDPVDGIYFVGVGAFISGTADVTVTAVPGIEVGDYAMIFAYDKVDSATIAVSGWTEIASNTAASRGTLTVFGKVWAGGESLLVDTNQGASGLGAFMVAYRYVNPTTQMDATPVDSDAAAAATWAPTGITSITDGARHVTVVASLDDNALVVDGGNEQGFRRVADFYKYDTTSGTDFAFGLADKVMPTAGAATPPTWRQTLVGNDAWIGISLALRPLAQDLEITGSTSLDFGMAVGSGGAVTSEIDVTGVTSLDFGTALGTGTMLMYLVGGGELEFGMAPNPSGAVESLIENTETVYRLVLEDHPVGEGKIKRAPLWRRVDRIPTPYSVVIRDGVAYRTRVPPSTIDPDSLFLGGHEYTIRDSDPRYPILVAAGVTMEAVG